MKCVVYATAVSMAIFSLVLGDVLTIDVECVDREPVYSCNSSATNCTITVESLSSCNPDEIEYNCPNGTMCEFCEIYCKTSRDCAKATINAYACADVIISAEGARALEGATIVGPENGDLTITALARSSILSGTTITGPTNGDLEITAEGGNSCMAGIIITGPTNGDVLITAKEGGSCMAGANITGPSDGDMQIFVGEATSSMNGATVIGPTNGDLNITHYVSTDSLVSATIDVTMSNNAYIQILDKDPDVGHEYIALGASINGNDMSGILEVTCGAHCHSLEVSCPSDSILNPSCIIDCSDAVSCAEMNIYTLQSHYYPIQFDCGTDEAMCSGSMIHCGEGNCTMTHDSVIAWNCIGQCTTEMPTSNPSKNPTMAPSKLPTVPMTTDNSSMPDSQSASTTFASNSTKVGSGSDNTDDTDASANPQQPVTTERCDGSSSKDDNLEKTLHAIIIIGIVLIIVIGMCFGFCFCGIKRYWDFKQQEFDMITEAREQNYQTNQMRPPQPTARPYNPQNTIPSSAMGRMTGRTENTRRGTGRGGYANRPSQSYSGQPVRPMGINARPPARQVRRGPQTGQPVRDNRGDRNQNHDDQGVMDNIWNEIGRETPGGSGYL